MSIIGLVGRADSPPAEANWADRVQELHIIVIHTLIELVEAALFDGDMTATHLI